MSKTYISSNMSKYPKIFNMILTLIMFSLSITLALAFMSLVFWSKIVFFTSIISLIYIVKYYKKKLETKLIIMDESLELFIPDAKSFASISVTNIQINYDEIVYLNLIENKIKTLDIRTKNKQYNIKIHDSDNVDEFFEIIRRKIHIISKQT